MLSARGSPELLIKTLRGSPMDTPSVIVSGELCWRAALDNQTPFWASGGMGRKGTEEGKSICLSPEKAGLPRQETGSEGNAAWKKST